MPTTVGKVWRYVEADLVLREALRRGVLSLRRAARWLIRERGIDATEEAVVSALRRYASSQARPAPFDAWGRLAVTRTDVRAGLAMITARQTLELHEQASPLDRRVGTPPVFCLLPGRGRTRFLVDHERVDTVANMVASSDTPPPIVAVAEIRSNLGKADESALLALPILIDVLIQRGIHVLEVYTCMPDLSIIVPASEALMAHKVVEDITKRV